MSKRYPRPSGLTLLAKSLQKTKSKAEHNRLKVDILKKTVSSYVNNGFTFMGKTTNINDLAFFIQVTPNRVMMEISRYSKTLASIADPEQTQQTLQAMVGLLLQNVITDRGKVQKQADMLVAAQGGTYRAFVSKEANAALKNLLDSNKPLIDLVKLLQGPNATYIQNNLNSPDSQEPPEDTITVDEAVAMIDNKNPESLLESPHEKDKLFLEEGLDKENLPEVVATKQRGFELQGGFASEPKLPKRKATHEGRNEDGGDILDGIEDTDFEDLSS